MISLNNRIIQSLFAFLIVVGLIIPLASCGGGSASSDISTNSEAISTPDEPDEGTTGEVTGITSRIDDPDVSVEIDGNGDLVISGGNLPLVVETEEGFVLDESVEFHLYDSAGNEISGNIIIDQSTGQLHFVPEIQPDPDEFYTLSIIINGEQYDTSLQYSINSDESEADFFKLIPDVEPGTYSINSMVVQDRVVICQEFGTNEGAFNINLNNLDPELEVHLTAYGVYDIEGYRDQIFYQRWQSSGEPVKDFVWKMPGATTSTFTIRVTDEDSSIDGPDGIPDYSFYATYIELRFFKNGIEITPEANGNVRIF